MSRFAPLFGRQGPAAGGDPQVAELLKRTVENQYKATYEFDGLVDRLQTMATTPWTAPLSTMAVTHSRWLSSILWQAASAYLDNVVVCYQEEGLLPAKVYEECDSLCDLAGSMTMQAIRLQSELDNGSRPPNASLVSLPDLSIAGAGYVGVWGVFETINLQVVTDFLLIEKLGIAKQMQDVYQTAKAALKPKADVFVYLESSWASTTSVENRKQLVREALPVVSEIFTIGQQLWAPYLLGEVYRTALKYKPTLDDLELGFDPWCWTDIDQKRKRASDKASQEELTQFWESIADPAAAYQLSEQLRAALLTDRIRWRTGKSYNVPPWPSQFLVRYPIQLGARTFASGDLIGLFIAEDDSGKRVAEVRRTGHVTNILELLGQLP